MRGMMMGFGGGNGGVTAGEKAKVEYTDPNWLPFAWVTTNSEK
jgi:hypothetical protein